MVKCWSHNLMFFFSDWRSEWPPLRSQQRRWYECGSCSEMPAASNGQGEYIYCHCNCVQDVLRIMVWLIGSLFSIHGIAASMLLWKNCCVPTILRTDHWRTHSVFADHFLWEIVRQEGGVFALGPVVAIEHSCLTTNTGPTPQEEHSNYFSWGHFSTRLILSGWKMQLVVGYMYPSQPHTSRWVWGHS